MSEYQPPIGGIAPAFQCNRVIDGTLDNPVHCARPARWHVIWNAQIENGLACDEHATEIRSRWVFLGMHEYDTVCSMPGAVYLHAEDRCVLDDGLLGLPSLAAEVGVG